MHFQKITLVGVGLLGGSLGLAVKQRKLAASISGYVRRTASIAECEKFAVVDSATRDIKAAVADADLIVLCTPLSRMGELAEDMLPALKPGAIVTDVGSVKTTVVAELEPLITGAGAHFIGSHPMCGGEKMGVSAARADLFQNSVCVVTPGSKVNPKALASIETFWRALEMRVLTMSPENHDELVSRSSHLPHVVAAELANYVLSPVHPKEQAALCANGFRDTTRIASGSPEMWRDIALANRKNLARVLGVFIEDLQEFRHALDSGNVGAIEEFFQKAKERRDDWRSTHSG
ncbi:MAG: Prephenate dehydrogenase [Verrucomicrobiales bacterium]|nr:Prephenate dehydrogenase [Verrucomicrobiales bacterium]